MTLPQIIEASREQSIQSHTRQPVTTNVPFSVAKLAVAGMFIPPWWSQRRDKALRDFWKKGDHISGAIYTMTSKMTSIPITVMARDPSVREHVERAEEMTKLLRGSAQFGEGWEAFFGKIVEDLITCDNGFFAEVIGPGAKDGPITGQPISVAHLDSCRCTRTGNTEYPVVYYDQENQRYYKLHWTRVMFVSQMASPDAEMNGVGFSALSRAINNAQSLIDIMNYKQEKLGSRPKRAMILTKGGLDPQDVYSSFEMADAAMDNANLSRYSKMVVIGSAAMPEADLTMLDLASLPDGFNEETSIVLGMASIALALGVDARELFPAMQSGATRADALLAHLKQRGKGPGQIIATVEQLFNTKFLPPHLYMVFDYQDDAQDRQVADIKNVRASRRSQDLNSGALTISAARRIMVQEGDLDEGQFLLMELQDGRLPDGTPLISLFYSNDSMVKRFLDLGTDDPLDFEQNDQQAMLIVIREQIVEANKVAINDKNPQNRRVATQCLMALAKLEKYYLEPRPLAELFLSESITENGASSPRKPDERTRRMNLAEPNTDEELDTEGRSRLEQSEDDNAANAGLPDRGAS